QKISWCDFKGCQRPIGKEPKMAGILLEGREVSDEERESPAGGASAKERTAALARLERHKPADVASAIAKAATVRGPILEYKVIAPGNLYSGAVGKGGRPR